MRQIFLIRPAIRKGIMYSGMTDCCYVFILVPRKKKDNQ